MSKKIDPGTWRNITLKKEQGKEGIYIRLDRDILRWFRSQGKGYQTFINAVLRSYVEAQNNEDSSADVYDRAQQYYRDYHAQCFWHLDPELEINVSNLSVVIKGLRQYGGHRGFLLAEELCQ